MANGRCRDAISRGRPVLGMVYSQQRSGRWAAAARILGLQRCGLRGGAGVVCTAGLVLEQGGAPVVPREADWTADIDGI